MRMSMRVVPSAALERIWVSPRVNSAEPCTRGETSTSHSIGRISSWARPSGRFLSTAIALRIVSFSIAAKAALASEPDLVGLAVGLGGVLGDDLVLDVVDRLVALELALGCDRVDQRLAVRGTDLGEQALVDLLGLDLDLLLADLLLELLDRGDDLLDLTVGDVERVEDLLLGDAAGAGLDHEDRLLGAGDDQVEVELGVILLLGLTTKSPSSLPIRTAPTVSATGTGEIASAAEAPFIARMS